MIKLTDLTEQSKNLLIAYMEDAANWCGNPLVGGNVEVVSYKIDRGNLTHLKKLGLIKTDTDEGCTWIYFQPIMVEFCKELGYRAIGEERPWGFNFEYFEKI